MKVDEFLSAHDLSGAELSKQLGFKGAERVNRRRREGEEIPEDWIPKLRELGYEEFGGEPRPSEEPQPEFREADRPPQAPDGAQLAYPKATKIDYSSLAGHIEGIYKLSADMAIGPTVDETLATCIHEHAEAAGKAWARYIESEPRVAALIERMMIGTPLGEVIGVHVGIFFSYLMARTVAQAVQRDYEAQHGSNGDDPSGGFVDAEAAPEPA